MNSWRHVLDEATRLRRAGEFDRAREIIKEHKPTDTREQAAVRAVVWAHEPFWWEIVQGRRCRLRRRAAQDVPFIRSLWADREFMSAFNRFARLLPASDSDLGNLLAREHASIITEARAIHWTIETLDARKVGILSLVDVALSNRRAEILIGLKDFPYSGIAAEAMLLAMEFGFNKAGLNKLYSLIYAGNESSIRNTAHLGFEIEGRLREHVVDPNTRQPVDLIQTGLLRSDLQKAVLTRLSRRLLRRDLKF
jgi:ribosomal-protein-alanine N-acetyltransferase